MSNDRVNIAGYDYGRVARSPVTLNDLHRLEQTMGFGDADRRALLEAGEILGPQAEALVDGWRKQASRAIGSSACRRRGPRRSF